MRRHHPPTADNFPNGGPGRGGAWWNDPTYWVGLALGAALAMPLINRLRENGLRRQDRVRGAGALCREA